jgi:hypothetical protein
MAQTEAKEHDAGVSVDNPLVALSLLPKQDWWPEFIKSIRQELGVESEEHIGRWQWIWKEVEPYIYECGYAFQTPSSLINNGQVLSWMWKVDLKTSRVEPIEERSEDHNRLTLALSRVLEVQGDSLDEWSQDAGAAMLIGGWMGASMAIKEPAFRELWAAGVDDERVAAFLQVFTMVALSQWLRMMDGDRSASDRLQAREMWAEVVLRSFGHFSPENVRSFLARDRQFTHEGQAEGRNPSGGTYLVYSTLLWSDALEALGGQPWAESLTTEGFPYESTLDLLQASGASILNPVFHDVGSIVAASVIRARIAETVSTEYVKRRTARSGG